MTLTDFLALLATKYERVGKHEPAIAQADFDKRKADLGYSFYRLPVDDLVTVDGQDLSKTGVVLFKVYDEGLAGEKVVWEEKSLPEFQPRPADKAFDDQVRAWYTANKPAEIVKFEVLEANKDLRFAILRVFEASPGQVAEKKIFLWDDGSSIQAATLV